jgi:DNA-binding NarL/FixJ family response regulator
MTQLRVLLAEDSALTRGGLAEILRAAGHLVETVADGDQLENRVSRLDDDPVDIVVTDVRMPPSQTDEGLRTAAVLRQRRPPVPVLVLSAYVEAPYASELLAGSGGGVGYLLKDRVVDVGDFLDAVTRVASGGTVVDPEVMRHLLRRRRSDDRLSALSPREHEVLALMAEGATNATIGRELVIGQQAVEKHVGNVFAKLDLPTDLDANRRVLAVIAYLDR